MRPLILNSNNVVPNGFNDTYLYRFPNGSVSFENDTVAIGSISLYYSWYNITSLTTGAGYNNNVFQYVWYSAGPPTTVTVTLPDGAYEIEDLNAFLQYTLVQNNQYLVDNTGKFIYYLELVANTTYGKVQFNSYPIPTALPGGWSAPPGFTFPAVATTPQLIIPSTNNFGDVIGFNAGTYPAVVQATNYSVLSQIPPQITNINSIIVSCNLLNNKYSVPNTLLYSFAPLLGDFGSPIVEAPNQLQFCDIQDGSYTFIEVDFKDQNLNRIQILDPNLVIVLVIAKKTEFLLK
jgi:hypothetical protein